MAIKILLVDDHRLIREGLAAFLEDDSKYELIGGASDGIDALEIMEENLPHGLQIIYSLINILHGIL